MFGPLKMKPYTDHYDGRYCASMHDDEKIKPDEKSDMVHDAANLIVQY